MRNRITFLISLMVIGVLLSACGTTALAQTQEPQDRTTPRTLTVTGSGKTTLAPDIAYISIGVQTENKEAATALEENSTKSEAVVEALAAFNIDPKDIQTSTFNIFPRQDYDPEGKLLGVTFAVDNTVFVTLRNIEQIGAVLDAAVKAGSNSISGIQFDVEDKREAISQAREAAVADAQQQATELAAAAGVTLGEVQSITSYSNYPVFFDKSAAVAMEAAASSVSISPGQVAVTAEVSVTYLIQ